MNLTQKLIAKIAKKGPDDCWEWTGHKQYGYGRIKVNGREQNVTRILYSALHGPISEGLVVMHLCDNPSCCNPKHLKAGTHAENIKQRDDRGRRIPPKGESNGRALVNEDTVREIRRRYSTNKVTCKVLAEEFEVKVTLVYDIVLNRSWKHVT